MANADQGFGLSITFSSGFLALIRSASWGNMNREALNTTHMGTTNGAATFIPSDIEDYGELTVELLFDPDDAPPITGAAETVTVTFPIPAGGSSAATWACSGFLTSFEMTAPHDNLMTATATIKFTGEPTFTDGT